MIVSGSGAQSLAAALATRTGEGLATVDYDRFPDGEQIVSVGEDLTGERAVVVAATDSDRAHVELLLLQDAAREAGAESVVTVLGYMGYARQDRPAPPGEDAPEAAYPLSARAVARAASAGSDRTLVVEPHERAVCEFFEPAAEPVEAAPRLADPLPDLADPLFLAPDEGALDLAETVCDAYGRGTVDAFEKHRRSGERVEVTAGDTAVADREVVLVDDVVATGSTMAESVAVLGERGAAATHVACVHPLLAGNARSRLARAGVDGVYATDTLERPETAVSVAPAVAEDL
jgi:ribose-phosphate pyrophosphokinase